MEENFLFFSSNKIDKRCDNLAEKKLIRTLCFHMSTRLFFFSKRNANISSFISCLNINLKFERFLFFILILVLYSLNVCFVMFLFAFSKSYRKCLKKSKKSFVCKTVIDSFRFER